MKTSPKFILRLIEESGVGFNNAKNKPEIKERISQFYNEALLRIPKRRKKEIQRRRKRSARPLLAYFLVGRGQCGK